MEGEIIKVKGSFHTIICKNVCILPALLYLVRSVFPGIFFRPVGTHQ